MPRVIGYRVLVKPDKVEEKTKSGIIVPTALVEEPLCGTVVSAGKGNKSYKMFVKEGDRVLYSKFAGSRITIENEDYLIMPDSDVLAITL